MSDRLRRLQRVGPQIHSACSPPPRSNRSEVLESTRLYRNPMPQRKSQEFQGWNKLDLNPSLHDVGTILDETASLVCPMFIAVAQEISRTLTFRPAGWYGLSCHFGCPSTFHSRLDCACLWQEDTRAEVNHLISTFADTVSTQIIFDVEFQRSSALVLPVVSSVNLRTGSSNS